MGRMREALEKNQSVVIGILDELWLEVANDAPTLCSVIVKCGEQTLYVGQASIGQLRALCRETARAVNILLDIQGIQPHKKVTVDGETPL